MRDIKRIKRILKLIEELWTKSPDQRLGQLLRNYAGFTNKDNWNVEDDKTELFLKLSLEVAESTRIFKETGKRVCPRCKTPLKQIDKYTFELDCKPDCEYYNKNFRLSIG